MTCSGLSSPSLLLFRLRKLLEASSWGKKRVVKKRPLNIRVGAAVIIESARDGHGLSLSCLFPSPTDLGDERYDEAVDDLILSGTNDSDSLQDSNLLISKHGGFPCIFSGERTLMFLSRSFGRDGCIRLSGICLYVLGRSALTNDRRIRAGHVPVCHFLKNTNSSIRGPKLFPDLEKGKKDFDDCGQLGRPGRPVTSRPLTGSSQAGATMAV